GHTSATVDPLQRPLGSYDGPSGYPLISPWMETNRYHGLATVEIPPLLRSPGPLATQNRTRDRGDDWSSAVTDQGINHRICCSSFLTAIASPLQQTKEIRKW
ncbi:hypothetical protein HAX54_049316, partial [Datura stramonium]|nr:hypothetical protein [Datura stramonium]